MPVRPLTAGMLTLGPMREPPLGWQPRTMMGQPLTAAPVGQPHSQLLADWAAQNQVAAASPQQRLARAMRPVDWSGLGYTPQQARAMGFMQQPFRGFGVGGGQGDGRSVGRGGGGFGDSYGGSDRTSRGPGGILGHI